MKTENNTSYNNLIDECLKLEGDTAVSGKGKDLLLWIIGEYFFKDEKSASKNIELVINNLPPPPFHSQGNTIFNISMDELRSYILNGSFNESLAGKIMLSPPYLKSFYPNHPPAYAKLPEDVRFELMDAIKAKNEAILSAFEKMLIDRNADKQRKILTLVALILKNIHLRSEAPLKKLERPAEETIRSIFNNTEEIFAASQKQVADLSDDVKIRQLTKAFFMIKQFKDIAGIAAMFKEELERFRKRTISAAKNNP
jgi:hypothetical protein